MATLSYFLPGGKITGSLLLQVLYEDLQVLYENLQVLYEI